jgi:hypothetical protein
VATDLEALLTLPDGPPKTAALVAWLQGLYPDPLSGPVLVGGAAVELYTGGAYTSGDLDFVGTVPVQVERRLLEAGFVRRGRHWVHEPGQLFVEFPGAALAPGETTAVLRLGDLEVLVVSPEDLLVDRLGGWQHWRSSQDGVNAFLLHRAQGAVLDRKRLQARAEAAECVAALASLLAFARRHGRGGPTASALERWARRGPCA